MQNDMGLTSFIGTGCLYADAVEGVAACDLGWPVLELQNLPHSAKAVRVDRARGPCAGEARAGILYAERQDVSPNRQATLHSRYHLHFEIIA